MDKQVIKKFLMGALVVQLYCYGSPLFVQNRLDSIFNLPEMVVLEKRPMDIITAQKISGEKLEGLCT